MNRMSVGATTAPARNQTRPRWAVAAMLAVAIACAAALPALEHRTEAALPIVYVKADAAGLDDGSSWTNAYQSLWVALFAHPEPVQFWVARGTYVALPLFPPARAYRFVIQRGQQLYGGFEGTETSLDQRGSGRSTLSGERGGDGPEDNFYNVVTFSLTGDETAILDGFRIIGGYDDRSTASGGSAGGIVIPGGKPLLENVSVEDNWGQHGAGIHIEGGAPTFRNLFMHWNTRLTSPQTLGGISASAGDITIEGASLLGGPPTMEGSIVDFDGVTATISYADLFSGESTVGLDLADGTYTLKGLRINTLHTAIAAASAAVSLDGAWINHNEVGVTTSGGNFSAANVTFGDNTQGIVSGGTTTIDYSTFVNNGTGAGTVATSLTNVIIQSDGTPAAPAQPATVTHAIMDAACAGQVTCTDVSDVDPLLGALAQPLITPNQPTGVFPLKIGSPAVDAGDGATCPGSDATLTARPVDGDGDGDAKCDLGAFELDPPTISFRMNVPASEGGRTLKLLATIAGTLYTPASVDYRVLGGTATRDVDYTLADGTLTFPLPECDEPGAPAAADCPAEDQAITLALREDFLVEPTETVVVELTNPSEAVLGARKRATARILDNEPRLKCAGVAATIVGSPAADTIRGTAARDIIVGRGGSDRVFALGGDDRLCGGPGDDELRGGSGRDVMFGHGGDDTLLGGGGNDELRGGGADDHLKGGGGNDNAARPARD